MSDVLTAALDYARQGWFVFPAPQGAKKSHKAAKNSGGRKWGATRDLIEIEQDFTKWPRANVGIVCGPDSVIWVMELDTPKGHNVDGFASLAALEAMHGKLPPTLMAESPSGSVHYYWRWPVEFPIQNSTSKIGAGIDVRGKGGMVIGPPSVRKDGAYRWLNDLPIASAPPWLIELARQASRKEATHVGNGTVPDYLANANSGAGASDDPKDRFKPPTSAKVARAFAVLDADCDYTTWMTLGAATCKDFSEQFKEWSRRSSKCPLEAELQAKVAEFAAMTSIKIATLFHHANGSDPDWDEADDDGDMPEPEPIAAAPANSPATQELLTKQASQPLTFDGIEGHYILRLKGKVRVAYFGAEGAEQGVLGLMSTTDFKTWLGHLPKAKLEKFIKKSTRYDGTCLDVKGTTKGKLNLWQGWAVEPKQGDWHLMQAHILYVIANNHSGFYFYLRNWMAWMVQNPDKQAEVAIVLKGIKGAGKGAFVYMLQSLFKWAQKKHIRDKKHLVGAFNSHLAGCCLLFADEAYWPGDEACEGALKGLITERTIPIEPKGIDLLEVENHLHIIIAGNAEWVVPASDDERRYAVQEVSPRIKLLPEPKRIAYFTALFDQINNGGAAAMLHELLNVKLGDWHPRQGIPATEALDKQKAQTRRGVDALVEQLCHDGSVPFAHHERHDVALTSGVNNGGFWAWLKMNHPSLKHKTPQQIMAVLRREWGFPANGFKSGNYRGIQAPSLRELRQRFEVKHGKQEWLFSQVTEWAPTHYTDDHSGVVIHRA